MLIVSVIYTKTSEKRISSCENFFKYLFKVQIKQSLIVFINFVFYTFNNAKFWHNYGKSYLKHSDIILLKTIYFHIKKKNTIILFEIKFYTFTNENAFINMLENIQLGFEKRTGYFLKHAQSHFYSEMHVVKTLLRNI